MTLWRRLLDLPFLVILMGICALAMYAPAAHALALRQHAVARAFFYSGTILFIPVAMIAIATATYRPRDHLRSHLAALVGAYLVLPVLLAVPMQQALPDTSFVNAWFEMLSSFTTTGATLYDIPDRLPPSLHLWRALVGWMGGFFILLSAVAVLAPMTLGGAELFGAEASARGLASAQTTRNADPSQRVIRYTGLLFPVYAGLTLMLWVGLLMAGDTALIALCHAMATLSTSGISPLAGIEGAASGRYGEALIFLFLCLSLTRRFLHGGTMADRSKPFWYDPELRLGLAVVAVVAAVLFLRHWIGAYQGGVAGDLSASVHTLWGAVFTTLSFLTTTGFVSADWNGAQAWSGLTSPGLILVGLAVIGGGVATTAGGVKLLRVYALLRHGERELERIIHPHSIGGHGSVARRLRRDGAYLAWIFFMLFGLSIAGIVAALTLIGLEFREALVLAVACLTTAGPLANVASDTPIGFAALGSDAKIILGAAMILGRLEILAILALLVPKRWER